MARAKTMRILPLGGLGEIGKNMTVVEYRERIVVIDAGVSFPTPQMHGVDLVLPDFDYLLQRREAIEAIAITHGHEDHLGALPWLLRELGPDVDPVVLARRLPAAMAKSKLDEHRLKTKVRTVEPGETHRFGPFELEFVHLTHSIPDAAGIAVGSPAGTALFTGDYRFDQTPVHGGPADFARLARFGEEGLLLLCGDSTNAGRPGFAASESEIGPALHDVFSRCTGRVVVTSFASNIHRVQQVVDAARSLDRHVALLGRSMLKNSKIARSLGLVSIEDGDLIPAQRLGDLDDEKIVVMCTGSQGEPLSALRRMAYAEHRDVRLKRGDTVVFSATSIPGNERAVEETIDRLAHIGCSVVTASDAPIHTSGHGHQEEMKLMLNLTRPRFLLPVHGDHRRIEQHARLAEAVGVPPQHVFRGENGLPLDVGPDGARFGKPERAGMIYVDGAELGDPAAAALRDRRSISGDGVVFVVATISAQDGSVVAPPEVVMRGVPQSERFEDLVDELLDEVEDALERAAEGEVHEIDAIEALLQDSLAPIISKRSRRRPMLLPLVIEV